MKRAIKSLAQTAIHSFGIVDAVRYTKRRGCRILTYHRFPHDRSHLERQCEHIRRHYHPVSMTQVAQCLREGTPLPDNALAFTIDDGFRDFLVSGHPVLARFEIPSTVFLVTDFLDRKLWLWFNQVEYMCQHTPLVSANVHIGAAPMQLAFASAADRSSSTRRLVAAIKKLSDNDRRLLMTTLPSELHVDVPVQPPPEHEPLSWEEVRTLASKGVEFGAHTKTHVILSKVEDSDILRDEIVGSKARLDAELGRPTAHFCYPNGRRTDYDDRTLQIVHECGFQTAVTTEGGLNYPDQDLLQLRRQGLEPVLPDYYFIEMVAGMRVR